MVKQQFSKRIAQLNRSLASEALRSMSRMEIPTRFVEKAKFVRRIFTNVEREYDTLLHAMTLSLDWVWRHRLLSKIDFSRKMKVMDLACGTGLVTFELNRLARSEGLVVGLDLSLAMLKIATIKKHNLGWRSRVEFVRAAGEFLPFREETFSYVTVGLALRNFGDKSAVFRESFRILLRAGWFLSVDFVRPENSLIWRVYRFHISHVLPNIGRLVSIYWNRTLTYLAKSIMISTPASVICRHLLRVGFRRTILEKLTLGVVVLVAGQK